MPQHTNPNPTQEPESIPANPSVQAPSAPFTPKSPDTRTDRPTVNTRQSGTTVKDPKAVGSAEDRADRVADKAAHKAAHDQQEQDKGKTTFTH